MILAIISAILLILAFPNFNLNYLAFIGFVPLFFAVHGKSPKKAFLISYVCGFLFYLGALYWLYHVTVFGLVALCLYLALYFGVFGVITNRGQKTEDRGQTFLSSAFCLLSSVLYPLIWIALEWLQAHLFTGFGWTLLGYSQYKNIPFIQIADFSGVYGVSFVIMLMNVAVWELVKVYSLQCTVYRRGKLATPKSLLYTVRCTLYTLILILILVYAYGFFRLNEEVKGRTLKASLIQGNIPQDVKWDPVAADGILNKYTILTKMAALDGPDLIIWPETSFPGFLVSERDKTARVLDLAKEIKTPLLLGANTEEGLDIFNSAVLISGQGRILDRYDKVHLVPFGEYVPFSEKFPAFHDLILGQLGEFTEGSEFAVFSLPSALSPERRAKFSVLICYEDIFPEISRRFVQNGAEFLVVITNDAWYGKTSAAYQHAACSVFRAIENRVPVVRSANTGYSCFIDSKGRIYDPVEKNNAHLFITGHKTSILRGL